MVVDDSWGLRTWQVVCWSDVSTRVLRFYGRALALPWLNASEQGLAEADVLHAPLPGPFTA